VVVVFVDMRVRAAIVIILAATTSAMFGVGTEHTASATSSPAAVGAAWGWLQGQLNTATTISSDSVITSAAQYPSSWTGAVSGTFTLSGVPTPSIDNASPIVIDAPTTVGGDYRGPVTGHVTLGGDPDRWIVQVLRRSDEAQMTQVPLQALVAADGSFSLDLSQVAPQPAGSWGFEILDAQNSYSVTGPAWPTPGSFHGLIVQAYVTTDTSYLIASEPALADGTFTFPTSAPGAKSFQLRDAATNNVLAEWAPHTGLVRSFDVAVGDPAYGLTYTYDQALSLLCALSLHDSATAATLAAGLVSLQTTGGAQDGGFVESAAALNPGAAVPEYRTGIHSIATYALLRYLQSLPVSDGDRAAIAADATRAVTWLLHQQVATGTMAGLVTGGAGAYSADGSSFDPSATIDWTSTEHDLDAWHTLGLAATVLDDSDYHTAANQLQDAIYNLLWQPAEQRFLQGWTPTGADDTDPLDVDAWGAIFFDAISRPDLADAALTHTALFAASNGGLSGYAPSLPLSDPPLIWFEGTAGVALAQQRNSDTQLASTLTDLDRAQRADGSLPGANLKDTAAGMTDAPAAAATAWFILANQAAIGDASIWDEGSVNPAYRSAG
jgi:hypothetical protein